MVYRRTNQNCCLTHEHRTNQFFFYHHRTTDELGVEAPGIPWSAPGVDECCRGPRAYEGRLLEHLCRIGRLLVRTDWPPFLLRYSRYPNYVQQISSSGHDLQPAVGSMLTKTERLAVVISALTSPQQVTTASGSISSPGWSLRRPQPSVLS